MSVPAAAFNVPVSVMTDCSPVAASIPTRALSWTVVYVEVPGLHE